jgi:DNA-binding NarL/FixJ family response regulator
MPIRIILADDHLIVRQGLKSVLEREGYQVCGEGSDGHQAIQLVEQFKPDVAVVDYAMPLLNGIDTCREIHRLSPKTMTILLTMHTEDQYVLGALKAGIKAFLVKTQAMADLIRAIQEVHAGGIYLSPRISRAVVQAYLGKSDLPPDPLSGRERQVLQLIAEGKSTKEVARVLGISYKTAESHRTRLMEKLDIHETASIVRYAIRQGIVQA